MEEKIRKFEDLRVWQKGHELVLLVYEISKQFPREEMFGLTSQIRRAVVSITSNIAEGFSRRSPKDKLHYWAMSKGSLTEIGNQLRIARDVGYLNEKDYEKLLEKMESVGRLLTGIQKATSREE